MPLPLAGRCLQSPTEPCSIYNNRLRCKARQLLFTHTGYGRCRELNPANRCYLFTGSPYTALSALPIFHSRFLCFALTQASLVLHVQAIRLRLAPFYRTSSQICPYCHFLPCLSLGLCMYLLAYHCNIVNGFFISRLSQALHLAF